MSKKEKAIDLLYTVEKKTLNEDHNVESKIKIKSDTLFFKRGNGEIGSEDDIQLIKDNNGEFYVSGADFGYPDVKVKTDLNYVQDGFKLLSEMSKSEILSILIGIKKAYKNKTSDELYKCNEKWQNFCCDIVLFYCCRYKVDNDFQIPVILPTKELNSKFNKNYKK